MKGKGHSANRLANERSTYLRDAAMQPIDWFPWCHEAFEKARREGKPVLLDIGASWCHWCHVMDEGTYENSRIAQLINEKFVAVKVDRDERPDIDGRYQKAVNAMTGQGGWPLTVFLDNEGRPFYGGTYFPPERSGQLPGFDEVLEKVHDYYSSNRDDASETGKRVLSALRTERGGVSDAVRPSLLSAACLQMISEWDRNHGGFGHSPKFPHTAAIEFLMASLRRGNHDVLPVIVTTLNKMQEGGIMDQLEGGFHRYSTDEKWIVPHFEKMSYDNAFLLKNYVHGYQIFRDQEYRKTAELIMNFVESELMSETGFFATQDADAFPGDDGDYWTWSPSELSSVLSGKEYDVASLIYHVHGQAEMHDRRDRHVLYRAMTVSQAAERLSLTKSETEEMLNNARAEMLSARRRRPSPRVDRTVFSNWNGMIISSIYEYARAFSFDRKADFCRRAIEYAVANAFDEETGFRHVIDSPGNVSGFLEDQVHMGLSLIDAFCYHGSEIFLDIAASVAKILSTRYTLPSGLLSDTDRYLVPPESGELSPVLSTVENVPLYDAPNPSPIASAAIFFQRLGAVTGESPYLEISRRILNASAEFCAEGGSFAGSYFQALDCQINGQSSLVIVGSRGERDFEELRAASSQIYLPAKETIFVDLSVGRKEPYSGAISAMIERTEKGKRAFAFLCRGTSCSPPSGSAEELIKTVGS
jgi:uncharacterized protein YyaL (SSP411 family)